MKKTVVLIIVPDFKNYDDVKNWEENVNWAYEKYNSYPLNEDVSVSIEKRWAIGFIVWNKLIDYLRIDNLVDVFFIRTDYRLNEEYKIEDKHISIRFDNQYGHIIYKTLISMDIVKNKYDYIVRGNLNTIIDINYLSMFVQILPNNSVFTSPFWEGRDYPFGYFYLISNDVVNHLVQQNKQRRWFTEDTADDYELTRVILKKYKHCVIRGCDQPWVSVKHNKPAITNLNSCGIKFDGGEKGEKSEIIINSIKNSNKTLFLYRIKKICDNKYFSVYKFLIKHIWNKVVNYIFNNLKFYNEQNSLVPHLEYERDEQLLVARYIEKNDVVLELGARYGSVSCIINKILENKSNQVSVEPDSTVWMALEKNMLVNNCSFHIYKGIISNNNYQLKLNGYGSTVDINNSINNMSSIKTNNISLENLQNKLGIKFNVLVADCEGFLETFLNENNILYEQLNKIIFECDRGDVCNYDSIKSELIKNNFKLIENGFQCVFIKQ